MDINLMLDVILERHEVIRETSYDKAVEIVRDLEKKIIPYKKIGLYGVGIEAEGLLHFISDHTEKFRIDYCFDKTIRTYKYKHMVENTAVYPIEKIPDLKIDCVILGSLSYREIFRENLNALGYQGTIIDLYSCLEAYIEDHFADYQMVYQTRQDYLKAGDAHKAEALRQLIKEYILLKDFKSAFYYIDQYVENQYAEYERHLALKEDIEKLLLSIKRCIHARNKKDVIINWVDALSHYDIPKFPFLKKKMEEGVCFENAYTVMPWTTETTKTILCGEYPIEGKLFLRENLSKDQVELLRLLDAGGYGFGYCGMPKFAKLFDEKIAAPVGYYDNKLAGSMQKQWDALDILCKSRMPVCILIHTLRETHEPFICGEGDTFIHFGSTEVDWGKDACRKQAETAGKYIDGQLAFWSEFYKENAVTIYMSDHGRVGNSPMNDQKVHIMLSVCGNSIERANIKSMFSLVKFPELISEIIHDRNDWERLTEDHVVIENYDAYDERVVKDTLSGRLSREEMYQCRGIRTATDSYYRYAYGEEYYFTDCKTRVNEIHNLEYAERIHTLKQLCGSEFIDISQYEKFQFSRLLYESTNVPE